MQQLTPQDIQFIKELCATYGVITNEHERIDFIKEYLESQGISTYLDFHGNLLAGNVKNPTVVLASHIDEVGVMVREIRDDGLVSVIAAGYINPSILLNSVIEFKTANGMVSGYVISDHMVSGQLGHKELHMHEVFVDVGLPSASEVMQRGITIGTLGRFERIFMEEENRIVASGLDNIVGTFINIKLLVENPELTTDYVFLFHRGEEKGSYGAETFQHRIFAPYSIVLDYFPAQVIETPIGDNFPTLDNGACVVYAAQGYYIDTEVKDVVETVGQNVPLQKGFMLTKGRTELEHFQHFGSLAINLTVPARGFHGGAYVASKQDIVTTYNFALQTAAKFHDLGTRKLTERTIQ